MLRRLLLLCALLVLSLATAAQGAPVQIQKALSDLNTRLGSSLTLNDLYWSWAQENYEDSSLGCPQAGQTYTPGTIVGYRFEFTYGTTVYDYRVSADESIVILCSETDTTQVTPEPTGTPDAAALARSNSLCPTPTGSFIYPRQRLAPGIQARVVPGLPNNLRSGPDRANPVLSEIPGGATFEVIDGPRCDSNGIVWWEVDYNGQRGFTAEGGDGEYYVEPLPGGLVNYPGQSPIDLARLSFISPASTLQGNFAADLEFTDGGLLVVAGAAGSEGVFVYDLAAASAAPRVLSGVSLMTDLDSFGSLLLGGTAASAVEIHDVAPTAQVVLRAVLEGHTGGVDQVAFAPDGAVFVSVGAQAITTSATPETDRFAIIQWDRETVAQRLPYLRGHTARVTGMAYSADGTLFTVSEDGQLLRWDLATGVGDLLLTSGDIAMTTLAVSPEGTLLAVGFEDGGLTFLDPADPNTAYTVAAHSGPVNAAAFTPAGDLVATAGQDGAVVVWNAGILALSDPAAARFDLPSAHQGAILDVRFSAEGSLLGTLGEDNRVILWNLSAG